MIKKLFFIMFFLGFVTAWAIPPLDRYGGHYEVNPDSTTGVHYKFYLEPNIGDFEYRAILQDIFTIWESTTISECSRWKVVNMLLEKRIDPYITYPTGVFRSTEPFKDSSLDVCLESQKFDLKISSNSKIIVIQGTN